MFYAFEGKHTDAIDCQHEYPNLCQYTDLLEFPLLLNHIPSAV